MTVFEWKITDLGNGEYGYIWITKPSAAATRNGLRVYVDPCNVDGDADYWFEHDPHVLFNCQWEDDSEGPDDRILTYWRSIGSPVTDRNSNDYEAPWFPWAEAGFTPAEVAALGKDDQMRIRYGSCVWADDLAMIEDVKFELAAEAAELGDGND